MPEKIIGVKDMFAEVPEDKRHFLIGRTSATAIQKDGENIRPIMCFHAEMRNWPFEEKGQEHVFFMDLKDALIFKRTIDRTLKYLEETGQTVEEIYEKYTK